MIGIRPAPPTQQPRRNRQQGMTLVELLVAMTIGVGLTLAVSSMVVVGENHKRTTTSNNDAEQTGAYAFSVLDRAVRSAGSSLVESAYGFDRGVLGCKLSAGGFLPRAGAFPAPFATNFLNGSTATAVTSNLRVAPLLIAKNASDSGTSDVLVVMGGSGSAGGVSRQVSSPGTNTSLILDNIVGFKVDDLLLVSQSGAADCLVEQVSGVASPPTLALNAGKPYYTLQGATTTLATLAASTASYVTPMGNAAVGDVQFTLFTVGTGRILNSYDLLQNLKLQQGSGATDAVQAVADGVDSLHALYGIDNGTDGVLDTWVDPGAAGYDVGTVMTTPGTMRKILAVRIALVLRGQYPDKNQVSPTTLTLFNGMKSAAGTALPGLQQTINLQPDDQYYRYRVFEFTVPLRNMLVLAK